MKGCIYITIGPQSCGKSTFLKELSSETSAAAAPTNVTKEQLEPVRDISIDDQGGVYLKVPTELFFSNSEPQNLPQPLHEILQTSIHQKSLSQRIYDEMNNEMRWITQRLCNQITENEFRSLVMTLGDDTTKANWENLLKRDSCGGQVTDWKACLLEAVEENVFVATEKAFDTVDLFVVEGIFKTTNAGMPESTENFHYDWPPFIANRTLSGLDAASSKLKFLAMNHADQSLHIAWGNTNSVSWAIEFP